MSSRKIECIKVLSRDLTTGNILIFDSIYKTAKHFGIVYVTLLAHLKSKNKGLGTKPTMYLEQVVKVWNTRVNK